MTRRLATDAIIVLEKAGYICDYGFQGKSKKPNRIRVRKTKNSVPLAILVIDSGTVNNSYLEQLLRSKSGAE